MAEVKLCEVQRGNTGKKAKEDVEFPTLVELCAAKFCGSYQLD